MSQNSDPPEAAAHRVAVEGLGDYEDSDAYDATDEELEATRGGGGRYLLEMADVLRNAGLAVEECDGWERRARKTGGLVEGPLAIIVHHTTSGPSRDAGDEANTLAKTARDRKGRLVAPLANLFLDRRGKWWVLAAGGANTNGTGGPWGPLPVDRANTRVIGIEAANNGVGEPWSGSMQDSYVSGVAALADQYDIETSHVLGHSEWTRRKIDPAGPSRFGSVNSAKSWDMNKFRAAVDAARGGSGAVQVIESGAQSFDGDTYVVRPGDTFWSIAEKTMGNPKVNWQVLADANDGPDRVLLIGAVLTIPGGAGSGSSVPAFPGEAKRGMTGPIVVAWQEALIAHGIIADNKDNHDGDFGDGMEKAVLKLQHSWGWSNATGEAGSDTWKKLQSVG